MEKQLELREISQCFHCPFMYEDMTGLLWCTERDRPGGLKCTRIKSPAQPPEWCPLRERDVIFKFKEEE